jgi:hypothetical protein
MEKENAQNRPANVSGTVTDFVDPCSESSNARLSLYASVWSLKGETATKTGYEQLLTVLMVRSARLEWAEGQHGMNEGG